MLGGRLSPDDEAGLAGHLEACPACQARLEHLTSLTARDYLAAAPESDTPLPPDVAPTLMPQPGAVPPPERLLPDVPGYEVLAEAGRGGMGVVYRARHLALNRAVALKMMLPGVLLEPDQAARFRLEAELAARVQHPNIVQTYEVGLSHGRPFIALEWVEGPTLAAHLAGRPQPPREAATLVETLARAVHAAHQRGVVHRDLKPANVMLQAQGLQPLGLCVPKITDFGLARPQDADVRLTRTGVLVGTPAYMAPEQCRGGASGAGPAADVYALGVILYEMLTGRVPFAGETPLETVRLAVEQEPAPPSRLRPGLSRDLETVCLKCLHKQPARRYASALELADDLGRWLRSEPVRARPVGRAERLWRWCRREPQLAVLAAVLVLVTGLGLSGVFWQWGRAVTARNAAERQNVELERQTYRANIAAAAGAIELNNVATARDLLTAAPERLRNWEWRYFHSQLDGARTVLRWDFEGTPGLALSPDGRRLACAWGTELHLRDTAAGQEVAVRRLAPPGFFREGAFSPDGTRLATGGDRTRVWDGATGDLLWEAPPAAGGVFRPDWSPDGRHLVEAATEGRVRVREAADGREIFAGPGSGPKPFALYSPDGRHVAARLGADTIRVWDVDAGKAVIDLRGPEPIVTFVYSPDGRRIATGSAWSAGAPVAVRVWDATTGELLGTGTGHANEVSTLAFSPDGRAIASGSMDQTIRLWDGQTARPRARLAGHSGFVGAVVFSPDGKRLMSASADQTVRLWDPADGRPVAVLRGHTEDVRLLKCATGGLIASSSWDRTVRLWDADLLAGNGVLTGPRSFVYDVAIRPDGREVAAAAWDGTVWLWDPTTGRPTAAALPHDGLILTSLTYSPDGRRLAVVVRGSGVWLWDLARRTHDVLAASVGEWNGDCRVAFHPSGRLLAGGSTSGPVRLWDVGTRQEVASLKGHEGTCWAVAFRPDGEQMASAAADGQLRLWDVATRETKAVLAVPSGVSSLAYSRDGRLLASGSRSKFVNVWRADTGEAVGTLQLGSPIYGIDFSADGTRLACACADNTIRLVDVATLREVTELRGHTDYVHAVRFSPDGTRLVSGSGDFTVRVWDTLSAQDRAGQK